MDLNDRAVKPKRKYDVSGRRRQAARNREAILDVARRLFLAEGYATVTVSRIATDAGVSVETIYKAFGGKPGLVRAIWERGLEGSGPVPAERRSDAMRTGETDARRIIENWGALTMEVAPLTAPIMLLARDAAISDPELAGLLKQAEEARLARMEHNARDLLERGMLRPGITLDVARDVLWTYSSAELYELLVVCRGWPMERYARFVASGIMAALLPADGLVT
jgi:AcrR family transcriptional regulator